MGKRQGNESRNRRLKGFSAGTQVGTSLASGEPQLGSYLCPEKNGHVRTFERDGSCTRGRVQRARVRTHLRLKAQVVSLAPPARQVLPGAGLSVQCPFMRELDVHGAVWVTCVLVCLAWPKFLRTKNLK